ncbi:MAG: hypothetical protein H6745_19230 [Deltaproteobacteria bacterium]|nr:hypothetical protein [Deltaproteobacteria bacterium]
MTRVPVCLVALLTLALAAPAAAAEPDDVTLDAAACEGRPRVLVQHNRHWSVLFGEVKTPAEQAGLLACAKPGTRARHDWAIPVTLAFLTRSDYTGHDPLDAALGVNAYLRLIALRPDADNHGANAWFAGLVAGYERVVPAAEMKAALREALDADVAEKLAAGVDLGLATAREVAPEAPVWREWEAYAAELAGVNPLLRELRAELRDGDAALALARLDEARAKLLAEAKDKDAAVKSPAFRELSGLARAFAAARGVRRPFEQALPEPLFPTTAHARPLEYRLRERPDWALDGWQLGRDAAREGEWRAKDPVLGGGASYTLPVKKVEAREDGTTRLTLGNRETLSYAGQCRTALVFIDAAGQGWGTDRCTGDSAVRTEAGPASATVPSAQLAAAKKGTVVELVAIPDGSEAYPVRVWDRRLKRVLAIGPFAL